jgi:hypothetical protein
MSTFLTSSHCNLTLKVNQIKQLLAGPPLEGTARLNVNVMVSYCWADSAFVLSRLAMELASRVRQLWLDRLGGDQGMGEYAKSSMQRGVQKAGDPVCVDVGQFYPMHGRGVHIQRTSHLFE